MKDDNPRHKEIMNNLRIMLIMKQRYTKQNKAITKHDEDYKASSSSLSMDPP